ncbi:MAG: hypothetical protein CL395_03275 [Acidiferrobacteraceae bacterium]|jgi:16S rRNA (uracil1498-N3)-methyltransferase|nr:hypothetical protein [Acidiferrobacteraceae bacterium]MCP4827813.1 16S rRNA (uracil(1498)-N(3))-methyltransferase [Pseudomonadota bacterium]HJP06383.1 RsmE family RNA methyltransferase [Arenicellales bacterium]|tara:strand:+ start:3731 stop:4474 length:744 start_codon:yes stop_codon:yes gene_type:complete
MSARHWFYLPELEDAGVHTVLQGSQASHAIRARRLRPGDPVVVFDGAGGTASGLISEIVQRPLQVHLQLEDFRVLPVPGYRIHLLSALPKGERQATMLDMATQLGMTDFTALACDRSVSQAQDRARARWQRLLIEACKQSHRPRLPTLHPPLTVDSWAAQVSAGDAVVLLGDAHGAPPAQLFLSQLQEGTMFCLLVGPEGGFTPRECDLLDTVAPLGVSLGRGVLRIETAAVAMVALAASLAPGCPE